MPLHTLARWLQGGEFSEFVRMQMRTTHIPGLSLAVIDQGDLVYAAGFGLADIASGRAMAPHTLLNVASITKTITCTAVMQMYEQGKLELDAPIDEYLRFKVRNPSFPHRSITPRHLLTHTSSIADGPAYRSSYICGDPQVTLFEWLRQYLVGGDHFGAKRNFKMWAPAGPHAYSNVGYGVLGLLVERVGGVSYTVYCQEHIFAQLSMADSCFLLAGMPREKHATPYAYVDNGDPAKVELIDTEWSTPAGQREMHVPHCLYSFATMPDGLLRTTAAELARFLLAHMRGGALEGRRILRAETVEKVLSDQHVLHTHPSNVIQGLAWYQDEGIWGHGGGDPGVSTYMGFRPTDGRGIVMLANVGGARTEIADRIFAWVDLER